jgi:hypothetical protein
LIFRIIGDLGNSLYMISDHILLLNRIGAYKFAPDFINKVDVISNLLWGIECFSNLIYDIVDYLRNITLLKNLNQSLKKIENKRSEGKDFFIFISISISISIYIFIYYLLEYINLLKKKAEIYVDQNKKLIDISRCITDIPVINFKFFIYFIFF